MADGLRSIRGLLPDSLRGLEPAKPGKPPKFEWVDPRELYVEDSYQRGIVGSGVALVRKIYAGFNWARFKTPICVRLPDFGNVLVCIDGQHTATACASNPAIEKIPVMVVAAEEMAARASSFVGHNRDRIGLTPPAIYHAELAAGEPMAILIDRACKAAGAAILPKSVNLKTRQAVGATIAIGTIRMVAKRHGEAFLVDVLRVLVEAGRGPIKADEVAAVAMILIGAPAGTGARLVKVIASKTTEQWAAIGAKAAADGRGSLPAAVAAAWCRELGIRVQAPTQKSSSSKSDAMRFVKRLAPADKPGEKIDKPIPEAVKPPEPPPASKPAPAPPPPVPAPVARATPPSRPPKPNPETSIRRNGVELDMATGALAHRGKVVVIPWEDGVDLVASLLRVMPSMLLTDRIIANIFGKATDGATIRLGTLLQDVAPVLRQARLEIKTIPKMGNTLFDLGPAEQG